VRKPSDTGPGTEVHPETDFSIVEISPVFGGQEGTAEKKGKEDDEACDQKGRIKGG
jgi:hypothetical protein